MFQGFDDDATSLNRSVELSPTTLSTLQRSKTSSAAAALQGSAAGLPAAPLEPDRRLILEDKSSSPSLKPDCLSKDLDEVAPAPSDSFAPDLVDDPFETCAAARLVAEPLVILCDVGRPLQEPDCRFKVKDEVPLF